MTNATRQAAWRAANAELAKALDRERHRKLHAEGREAPRRNPRSGAASRRFIGIDGEGGGIDDRGRQNYQLLRAGDMSGRFARALTLAPGESRLSTINCLEFILALPRDAILVGYYFGYDVTQILRDLPLDRMERLFQERRADGSNYTWWKDYGIEYIPKQYFRLCRINQNTCKTIPGSTRTINEVGGFFQQSFVNALKDWEIGDPKTLDMIAVNKDRREQFETIGAVENDYCSAECKALAQLMDKLREACKRAGIVPRAWRGAGHIAARLHELNGTPQRKNRVRWKIVDDMAEVAYYGGRFEITTIGRIKGTVWEYDINSAYPAAMLELPCPVHGRWKKFRVTDSDYDRELYIADITFQHSDRQFLCGFPIREKGRLYFPNMGSGVYWSSEIRAAVRAGASVNVRGGYRYIKQCDCKPFDWVKKIYEYRKSLGPDTKGKPIKLGINGLYGKLAQRIGAAPWRDYVMAGLMTAITRAKLIDAYAQAPADILYIATDAIYSRSRLKLDTGKDLGQWTETKRNGIFIVQPGIYWSGNAKPKTRGIPQSVIIDNRDRFEEAWDRWLDDGAHGNPPIVGIFVNQFIGLRAALARGKPELAGTWLNDLRKLTGDNEIGIRKIDFDWNGKRHPRGDFIADQCMVTQPYKGRSTLRSESYDLKLITEFQEQEMVRESDPDFYPWGNSGE